MVIVYGIFCILLFIAVYARLYLFLVPGNRLIILMYHQIAMASSEDLTVSLENLDQQFRYLSRKNYIPKFFSEIHIPARKSIIITFDDGYKNNEEYLPALLEKYGLKATIFIPTKYIQSGYKDHRMMTFEEIRSLDRKYFEMALHSHSHQNFREIPAAVIENDLADNMRILDEENIPYSKVLAYPYGKYPKKEPEKSAVFSVLEKSGIAYAVRIGNRINYFPSKRPYELCRIDIKGKDSMLHFKLKLIFGRLKLF